MASVAGGILSGLQLLEQDKERTSRREDRTRRTDIEEKEQKRLVRREKRNDLTRELSVITDSFNNPNTPDSVNIANWNGRYRAIMKELAPMLDVPTVTDWGKSLGKFSVKVNNVVHDQKKKSKEKLTDINALLQEADNDPEFIAVANEGKEDILSARKEREASEFEADKAFFRRNVGQARRGAQIDDEQDARQLARIKSKGPEYAGRIKDALVAEQGVGGDGTKFEIRPDPVTGQLTGIDPRDPGAQPIKVPSPGFPSGQGQAQPTVLPSSERITEQTLKRGTGPFSAGRAFISNVFGPFIPGVSEGSKQNKAARKKLAVFSQRSKSALINSSRGAVWEQQILEGRILPTSKVFTDPEAEFAGLLKLKEIFQEELRLQESMLQRGDIDLKTRKKMIGNNIELEALVQQIGSQLPQTVQDLGNLSLDDIRGIPKSSLNDIPKDVKIQMIKRLQEGQGNTSGSF